MSNDQRSIEDGYAPLERVILAGASTTALNGKNYSRSDRELLARIAHEVEGISVGAVREVKWAETEDHVKDEQLARLDRVLDNFDPSVFGKVARAVAAALDDAFLTEGADAELTDAQDEDAALNAELDAVEEERHRRRLDETGVGSSAPDAAELPELEIALRGEIQNPPDSPEVGFVSDDQPKKKRK